MLNTAMNTQKKFKFAEKFSLETTADITLRVQIFINKNYNRGKHIMNLDIISL